MTYHLPVAIASNMATDMYHMRSQVKIISVKFRIKRPPWRVALLACHAKKGEVAWVGPKNVTNSKNSFTEETHVFHLQRCDQNYSILANFCLIQNLLTGDITLQNLSKAFCSKVWILAHKVQNTHDAFCKLQVMQFCCSFVLKAEKNKLSLDPTVQTNLLPQST